MKHTKDMNFQEQVKVEHLKAAIGLGHCTGQLCIYVQQSGCWWASAPSPLTGFAIVCPCSHYDTATIAYKCSQFNSRYNCVQMFAIRDEMTDTGGDCACQAINGSPEKEKCHWCLRQYDAVYFLHRIETDCRKKLQSIQWTQFMQLQTKKYNPNFKTRFKTRNLHGYSLLLFLLIQRKYLSTLITVWVHLSQHQHPGHCPHILLRHFLSNVFLQSIIVEMYNCTDHIWV